MEQNTARTATLGPKVAIIGAGPAGLTLARLLQKNGIDCCVYEAEASRNVRSQGGTLDLHPKAGQRALREAGLFEDFMKHARPEGDADKLIGFDGRVYWDDNQITEQLRKPGETDKPEIDREQLRQILLDSVEPRRIQWNHKVKLVEADYEGTGKSAIHFTDGAIESGIDLLVGADGAWSKVRPLLTDVTPFYSGITTVELWSVNVSQSNPLLSQYVGAGSCFMFDEGRAILAQRMSNDIIRTYACVRQPLSWKDDCKIDWSDREAARKALVDGYFADCSADVKRLILQSQDELFVRQMWMLPVGATWQHRPGVTLIGDAAHLMTPFAGVGVNLAMLDALELARALVAKKDGVVAKAFSDSHNINAAVKSYEKSMFVIAKEYAEKTDQGLRGHFSAAGAEQRAQKHWLQYEKITGKKVTADSFNPNP